MYSVHVRFTVPAESPGEAEAQVIKALGAVALDYDITNVISRDRPLVVGPGIDNIDPQPFIDGWHSR